MTTFEVHDQRPGAPKRRERQAKTNMPLPEATPLDAFASPRLVENAYHATDRSLIFLDDVLTALRLLAEAGMKVDCVVTSPPFYGQRDYGVEGQIGLEAHPSEYIEKLLAVFDACGGILKPTGSLWVNVGDTYWSGKGAHKSDEKKQSARRFGLRPQDKKGDGAWCRPKQQLLIPHRFAIGMQDRGWLVRNDNVWVKPNPVPDQVRDRCSISHEYVFHFVKERWYYFDKSAVGRNVGRRQPLPPLDTWQVPTARGNGFHRAAFSEDLVRIPILATCPADGVVLDPFAGSGTSLAYALKSDRRAIGIDISPDFCEHMVHVVTATDPSEPVF